MYLLDGKKQWKHRTLDKASNETIKKAYVEYEQHELNAKGENSEKSLGKPVISMNLTGMSQVVKIRDVQKLQYDFENDPVVTDQMDSLGCLLGCIFCNFLALALVELHTVNILNLGMKMKVVKMIKYTRNSVSSAYAELEHHIDEQNFIKVSGARNA